MFSGIEHLAAAERELLRVEGSPLTIAYLDPMLRAQGLSSDRIGDAMEFFQLSEREVYYLLCDCHSVGR